MRRLWCQILHMNGEKTSVKSNSFQFLTLSVAIRHIPLINHKQYSVHTNRKRAREGERKCYERRSTMKCEILYVCECVNKHAVRKISIFMCQNMHLFGECGLWPHSQSFPSIWNFPHVCIAHNKLPTQHTTECVFVCAFLFIITSCVRRIFWAGPVAMRMCWLLPSVFKLCEYSTNLKKTRPKQCERHILYA